jgi:hypothetical protein
MYEKVHKDASGCEGEQNAPDASGLGDADGESLGELANLDGRGQS